MNFIDDSIDQQKAHERVKIYNPISSERFAIFKSCNKLFLKSFFDVQFITFLA